MKTRIIYPAITATALAFFTEPAKCRADDIFVTTGVSAASIEEFNPSGGVTFYASPSTGQGYLSNPTSIALDGADNLYVNNYGQANVLKINSSGAATIFASGLNSWSLAVDSFGNVYVSEGSNIEKFNQAGVGTPFANSGQNYFFTSLAFDSSGNLFAADPDAGTIEKFNTSGAGTILQSSFTSPSALAFDGAGNLYVASQNNTIEKFNPSGVGTVFANTGPYSSPVSMAFDSEGNLFVGCLGNVGGGVSGSVEEFNNSGVGSVFASGLEEPYGLAISAAPEPQRWSLWTLSIAGGLTLFGNYRRGTHSHFWPTRRRASHCHTDMAAIVNTNFSGNQL
jgi:hypothetical protein